MNEYERVVKEWAARNYNVEVKDVDRVDLYFDEGYYYSEYTHEDPHIEGGIYLVDGGCCCLGRDDLPRLGELLHELFTIAEETS